MNKQIFFIPGLFALGILAGIAIMNASDDKSATEVNDSDDVPVVDDSSVRTPVSWFSTRPGDDTEMENVNTLENKVAELEARIFELEQVIADQEAGNATTERSKTDIRNNQPNRMLTMKSLVKAGLDEGMAADILRRRNEIELKKLELRDRAAREDYIGTTRYMRELTALVEEQTTLREELGDEAYDRYLYATGQPNRVKVLSVMLGSTAEEAGMLDDDVVITYGRHKIFDGMELKNATTEGELGDYVNMDILRDEALMSLWVPRGPLGIRLGTARVEPY